MTTPSFTQLNNVEYNGFPKLLNEAFDQKIFISDNKEIYKDLKWKPLISYKKGINQMINWIKLSKIYKNV